MVIGIGVSHFVQLLAFISCSTEIPSYRPDFETLTIDVHQTSCTCFSAQLCYLFLLEFYALTITCPVLQSFLVQIPVLT